LLDYVEKLVQYPRFKFVVILDQKNILKAYISAWEFKKILDDNIQGDQFVDDINKGNIEILLQNPVVMTKPPISDKSTNIDTLKEMTDKNLEAIVVTNKKGNFVGVVEREQIICRLLIGITTQ